MRNEMEIDVIDVSLFFTLIRLLYTTSPQPLSGVKSTSLHRSGYGTRKSLPEGKP
jgi:hypothetical protein